MDKENKDKNLWLNRLTNKYRLVILNDESFEEVSSVRLSRFNVYILLSTLLVILVFLVASAIIFTPLREYIPGYASTDMKGDLIDMRLKTDSLEASANAHDLYIKNMQDIINGGITINKIDTPTIDINSANNLYDSINLKSISEDELSFRGEMEDESSYSLGVDLSLKENPSSDNIKNFYFFPPIKGYITDEFDPRKDHYGIDIVAPENEPIKTVMDGVVLFSQWTSETGYVIAIQHRNNLITLYKHNSVLLKKEGNFVKAGDVIAIIGNSGEQTTGPHLHFEIWYNGIPLNPKDYIIFN
jgi:murein DD-endopeptidase MepM/ murein hydrolase activator NlpD